MSEKRTSPPERGEVNSVQKSPGTALCNGSVTAQASAKGRRVGVVSHENGVTNGQVNGQTNGSMNGAATGQNGKLANGKLPKLPGTVLKQGDGDQHLGSPSGLRTGSKSARPSRSSVNATSPKNGEKSASPSTPTKEPTLVLPRSARPLRPSVAATSSPVSTPTSTDRPQRTLGTNAATLRPKTHRPSRVSTAVKPLPPVTDKKRAAPKSSIVRQSSLGQITKSELSPDGEDSALLQSFLQPRTDAEGKKKKKKVEEKAEISAENKALLSRVLSGSMKDLPALNSKIVRIFLSSTFTDMSVERNKLMAEAIPALKIYCRETHGLEFQVVDMRWGVRDEATDDHMTTELCMKEIANCQRLSLGPNFVAFLGNKYGYRPIPTCIPGDEFERLCEAVTVSDIGSSGGDATPRAGKRRAAVPVTRSSVEDLKVLQLWYKADENACPIQYILQPISSIYNNYNNKNMPHLQKRDQDGWWVTLSSLQTILRRAAKKLHKNNAMSDLELHNYLMSVTEREVCHGILEAPDTAKHCLVYVRDLNIPDSILPAAGGFVDLNADKRDEDAGKLLRTLRETKLVTKLLPTNINCFAIDWKEKDGIDATEHADYLQEFAESFKKNIMMLVDRAVEETRSLASDPIYEEVLQHSHACRRFVEAFQGRDDIITCMNDYMTSQSREPLIMYGESGCGKTSLLAKCYSNIPAMMTKGATPVTLLRFLGTTPDSSLIVPLLKSLSRQIRVNYNVAEEVIPDDISGLCSFFKRQLYLATPAKPLYIVLDSLDQLSPIDGAYEIGWMPISLPPNVKMVVSVALLEDNPIYENLRKVIDTEANFIRVPQLGEELGASIIRSWLGVDKRMVSVAQWRVIHHALSQCNLPLFVKLVFDEVRQWKSYTPAENAVLADSVQESIMRLFERTEKQHGSLLVSHALRYIAAAKSGLSEMELEDLLSLNEEVLNDVYQYHLPPVRRIPPLLWTRIRGDLPTYITEREADGVNVIDWYHRQFVDTSRKRYFRNVNNLTETHSLMADYFLGIWGGKPKPFEYSQSQRIRFNIDDEGGESDRKVPEQPLYFTDSDGTITHYNLRKLNELPHHLIRSGRTSDLYSHVLFNFRWLHAKLSCLPLSSIVGDFEDALDHHYDREVKLVLYTLRLSASLLMEQPNMLGPHLLGRLLPYFREYDNIRSLLQQCDTDGVEVNALVPTYHCLHTPGGPLKFSLEGHTRATFSTIVTSDKHHLVSISNVVLVYDLSTGEEFRKINPNIRGMLRHLSLSPDDMYGICVSNTNQLLICSLFTGEFKLFDIKLSKKDSIWGTAASKTNAFVYTERDLISFTYDGKESSRYTWEEQGRRLVDVHINNSSSCLLVFRTGVTTSYADNEMEEEARDVPARNIETIGTFTEIEGGMVIVGHGVDMKPLKFDGPLAMSPDRRTAYVCIIQKDKLDTPSEEYTEETLWRYRPVKIECYERCKNEWNHRETITECDEMIFDINISGNGQYLVASTVYGFTLWDITAKSHLVIQLPGRVRNIPDKRRMTNLVLFTNDNKYLVAGVRERIYVWDVTTGRVTKILDGHFKRLLRLVALPGGNKLVSSSFDKTIKVWDFDNLMCKMNPLDRHERSVVSLSVAEKGHYAVTTTRSGIGFWNLRTGKMRSLSNSTYSSTALHAVITSNGQMAITAEAGDIYIWNTQKMQVIASDKQLAVEQLLLTEKEESGGFLAFSRDGNGKAKCVCRKLPSAEKTFTFEYTIKTFKKAMFSGDRLYLIVPAASEAGQDLLSVFHARTGTHLYDVTIDHPDYRGFSEIKQMPRVNNSVILVEKDKCSIWDIKTKKYVRTVMRWNGFHTKDGRFGLHTPNIGGLELLDLKTGKPVRQLLTRANEGMYHSHAFFMNNDDHVVYYHGMKKVIKVLRLSDARVVAELHMRADVTCFELADNGCSLVLAGEGGCVTSYCLADPDQPASRRRLNGLANRSSHLNLSHTNSESSRPAPAANKLSFAAAARVVSITHKIRTARVNSDSQTCAIS